MRERKHSSEYFERAQKSLAGGSAALSVVAFRRFSTFKTGMGQSSATLTVMLTWITPWRGGHSSLATNTRHW